MQTNASQRSASRNASALALWCAWVRFEINLVDFRFFGLERGRVADWKVVNGGNGYCAGKLCIEVTSASKIAWISESLCVGCGICVKKCPMEALQIINLPKNLEKDTTHRYGPNQFKLHRLPTPRAGEVLGLVGTNGIGKSTALKVLAGKTKPNLGRFDVRNWMFLFSTLLFFLLLPPFIPSQRQNAYFPSFSLFSPHLFPFYSPLSPPALLPPLIFYSPALHFKLFD